MTDKVVKEVAEAEFERFAELMDLDLAGGDEEDRKSVDLQRGRIVAAIQSGALVINDDGEPEFTPTRSQGIDKLRFREPTGASLMAMDRKKKTEDIGKLYAIMADLTGQHANTFSKMKMGDLRICIAVVTLFLG